MGLFEKKKCMLCGKDVSILGQKLLDGSLCADCASVWRNQFLDERVKTSKGDFSYKNCSLQEIQECVTYFNEGHVARKLSKNLPQYLGTFAFDEENQMVEIKGEKAVYKIPINYIQRIIYNCYDDENANKMKFIYSISSNNCSWLDGYIFCGVFKNDGFFKFSSIKKAQQEIANVAIEMGIDMVSLDEFGKMIKSEMKKERMDKLKKVFSKW